MSLLTVDDDGPLTQLLAEGDESHKWRAAAQMNLGMGLASSQIFGRRGEKMG